jgi:hypothetical protein
MVRWQYGAVDGMLSPWQTSKTRAGTSAVIVFGAQIPKRVWKPKSRAVVQLRRTSRAPSRADVRPVPTEVPPIGRALGTPCRLLQHVSCAGPDAYVGPAVGSGMNSYD